MSEREQTAQVIGNTHHVSPQDAQERKQRILTQGAPAIVRSIADAVVIKDENIFFLTAPDGSVPLDDDHGVGLYYHDCRFINGYGLHLAGRKPQSLVSTAERGFMSVFQLTNPDIRMADGQLIRKEEIGVKCERAIDAQTLALHEVITFQNFGRQPIQFPVALSFRCGFDDVYAVQELLPEQFGTRRPPGMTASWASSTAARMAWIAASLSGFRRGSRPRRARQPTLTSRWSPMRASRSSSPWSLASPRRKLRLTRRPREMARLGEIPHTPYYGTVDATPLFLILIGYPAAWTGQPTLFDELSGPIEAALEWIDRYGDLNGDGYVEYKSTSGKGLINQGWKDSGDAIVNANGELAVPPIAIVEVQGYVYAAKRLLAELYQRSGDPDRAGRLRHQAESLRTLFNRDFW